MKYDTELVLKYDNGKGHKRVAYVLLDQINLPADVVKYTSFTIDKLRQFRLQKSYEVSSYLFRYGCIYFYLTLVVNPLFSCRTIYCGVWRI